LENTKSRFGWQRNKLKNVDRPELLRNEVKWFDDQRRSNLVF
jgi:hypothetical protein